MNINAKLYANISIPQESTNNTCLATETLEMFVNGNVRILLVEMRCPVIYDEDTQDSIEQKNERIKAKAFPIIYNEIFATLKSLFGRLTIEFPPLPSTLNDVSIS